MHTSPLFAHRLSLIGIATLIVFLSACQQGTPWDTKDISGLMPELDFKLTEANSGKQVTPEDYHGKIVLMFFGYTHCPDICPTTLVRLHQAVKQLSPQEAAQVRILFVTVDPKRDDIASMKEYSHYFGEEVRGLRTDDPAVLRALTKAYRVTYGYGKPDAAGNYNVSHSSGVYVFDRDGQARLMVLPKHTSAEIAHDLHRLIAEPWPQTQD